MSTGPIAPSMSAGTSAAVPASHHDHSLDRWPLRDAITLGALEGAVPSARAHVRQLLWKWGHADLAQDVSVVVSELVTNAVVASSESWPAIAPVQVWLGSDTTCLLISVADSSPQPPLRLNLAPDAVGGRGLALVEALSTRWGWYPMIPATASGPVKVVWADWRLRLRNAEAPKAGAAGMRSCRLSAAGGSQRREVSQ
jgi:anti-sigma regulatory factor (Ser/Thr protein kinase)